MEHIMFYIVEAFRSLCLTLIESIYKMIVLFFNIFERMGTASIVKNSTVTEIYQRVGLLLGLIMIFRMALYFIQYLINPDLITDKSKGVGNIVKKVLVVVVLLGVTPYLFREAYSLQNFLVRQNIPGKILLGQKVDNYTENAGVDLAWFTFSTFYRNQKDNPDSEVTEYCHPRASGAMESQFRTKQSFAYAYDCLNETDPSNSKDVKHFIVDFDGHGLIPLVVGIFLLWTIIVYTIQLGVRLLQLLYLQLIAPVPIIMYLGPKGEDNLSKWGKQCLTTYLDYFIRVAIMYFAVFLIRILIDNSDASGFLSYFGDLNLGVLGKSYVLLIMIIAILIFAKRVPKLLEEVFPILKNSASLDFGLKIPKESKQVGGAIAGAGVGIVGAGVSGISRYKSNRNAGKSVGQSLLGGAYGAGAGLLHGVRSGFTKKGVSGGWKNIQESNNKYNQLITSGGSTVGTIKARIGNTFGESEGQKFTRELSNYQRIIDDNKYVNDTVENIGEIKKLKTRWETLRMSGATEDQINDAFDTYKNAKKAALTAALTGSNSYNYDIITRDQNNNRIVSSNPGAGNFNGFEDSVIASQIEVRGKKTEDFIKSHNVRVVGANNNPITSLTTGDAAEAFKNASISASKSQTDIYKNNDYGAAMANDAAVGNDSNKTSQGGKKGGH